jgi:hypothetical protein
MLAACLGNCGMIRKMRELNRDARYFFNVNTRNEVGQTAAQIAIIQHRLDALIALRDMGADMNEVQAYASGLMHLAVTNIDVTMNE